MICRVDFSLPSFSLFSQICYIAIKMYNRNRENKGKEKKKMVRYVHGSADSLDLDVVYVFNEMPSYQECRDFCSKKEENRNIITIRDGIVSNCFIGTPDEINNALLVTYHLHEQEYPLLIEREVIRDKEMKVVRATRGILSLISRTQYRSQVKLALRSSFGRRLEILKDIDFNDIQFNNLQKQFDGVHIRKIIAFQLGQALGLLDGVELYTKRDIANEYFALEPFLYREEKVDASVLNEYVRNLIARIYEETPFRDLDSRSVLFEVTGRVMNLKNEEYF